MHHQKGLNLKRVGNEISRSWYLQLAAAGRTGIHGSRICGRGFPVFGRDMAALWLQSSGKAAALWLQSIRAVCAIPPHCGRTVAAFSLWRARALSLSLLLSLSLSLSRALSLFLHINELSTPKTSECVKNVILQIFIQSITLFA